MKLRLFCVALTLLLAAPSVTAQTSTSNATATSALVPRLIRMSGTLNTPSPASAAGSVVNVTFSLYQEETGGTSLWQETQNVEVDATGHYTALLGTTQAEGLPIDLFTSAQAQWLGVRPEGQGEQPRIMLVSVPFALKAGDAETLGGKPASAYVTAAPLATNSTVGINSTALVSGISEKGISLPHPLSSHPLDVSGSGTANYLSLWTSSSILGTSGIYQNPSNGDLGIGTTHPSSALEVQSVGSTSIFGGTANSSQRGVFGVNIAESGTQAAGVLGQTSSTSGYAVVGNATASTGGTVGVYGTALSPTGTGVYGTTSSATGQNAGVSGVSNSPEGFGVLGTSSSLTGPGTGASGTANSPDGIGVLGSNVATSGSANGVLGSSDSTSGVGVYGLAGATTGAGFGVEGTTATPNGSGVYGFVNSPTAIGVTGDNNATTGLATGVYGLSASPSGYGVYALNTAATGNAFAVYGQSNSPDAYAVYGTSSGLNGSGVVGYASAFGGNAYGVYGLSDGGPGVFGASDGGPGVYGYSSAANQDGVGIYADTNSAGGFGAFIDNLAGGYILVGTALNNGVHMFDVDGSGDGYFAGNLDVTGAITAGTKDFKIDHPLDPANKYLVHASVESSEMMNIYAGNIITNGEGLATVRLPEWFEALNSDFRYQLTVMGQFAQAIVADEIANHQFRIKTDKPNVKVSWQVTGVRHDAFANANRLQVEQEKALADRGHYLHPELFGAPKEARIGRHSAPHKAPAVHPLPVNAARALPQPIIPPARPLPALPKITPPALPAAQTSKLGVNQK
jgi:hypothetical protein